MQRICWFSFEDQTLVDSLPLEALSTYLVRQDGVLWLDIEDPQPEDQVILEEVFQFHPLCIEDCFHEQVVPKLEEFPKYLFMVLHGLRAGVTQDKFDSSHVETVELNLFLGGNFVVTLHKEPLQALQFLRDNLDRGTSAIYGGTASLAHEIMDALVDSYLPVLDTLDAHLNDLEDTIEANPGSDIVKEFFDLRRAILTIRRISIRQQEVFYWLSHRDIILIDKEERLLFRDIYDHLVRVVELSESARDILAGILNVHLSLVSNRMNDVMRILTIFSAILLPLTFIVGVYGMNFQHMPELNYEYGYYIVLGVMAAITIGMLMFFRHKQWL